MVTRARSPKPGSTPRERLHEKISAIEKAAWELADVTDEDIGWGAVKIIAECIYTANAALFCSIGREGEVWVSQEHDAFCYGQPEFMRALRFAKTLVPKSAPSLWDYMGGKTARAFDSIFEGIPKKDMFLEIERSARICRHDEREKLAGRLERLAKRVRAMKE